MGIAHNVYSPTWSNRFARLTRRASPEQKQQLFSKALGIKYQDLKEFVKSSTNKISCIYLMPFGDVKTLRESMNITGYEDNYLICKYGYTMILVEEWEKIMENIIKFRMQAYI